MSVQSFIAAERSVLIVIDVQTMLLGKLAPAEAMSLWQRIRGYPT
jgi:hypothetical protein